MSWGLLRDPRTWELRVQFPAGTRVELLSWGNPGPSEGAAISAWDEPRVPSGTLGTVSNVDDGGTIHVDWDNNVRIGMIPGVDVFREVV